MANHKLNLQSTVVVVAAVVIILAGIRAASAIVIPFLVSVFMATLAAPAVLWLHRHRIPKLVAILFVVVMVAGFLTLIFNIVFNTLQDINQNLPTYQKDLQEQIDIAKRSLDEILGRVGFQVDYEAMIDNLNLPSIGDVAGSTANLLTKSLLVTLIVLFMLLEVFQLPAKLSSALGRSDEAWAGFKVFAVSVKKYIAIKTATSFLTGTCACLWVWSMGVDYPLFWGLLAFLLNYVPNIGSIIAAAPAVLLAIADQGAGTGLIVGLGYLAINLIIGSLIEPHFMGDGVGLSPLVVFGSLVFWGWMLGGVGMLLSTPLTITVRIGLGHYPETRWIATMIGSGKA